MVCILENGEDRLLVLKPKELWECPGCVGSRISYWYPPVFYPGVWYPPFCYQMFFLKIQKLTFLMVLWWCFHGSCQFFDVCVTGDSLVLFFFSKKLKPGALWFWNLWRTKSVDYFEKSNNWTTLVQSFLFHFYFVSISSMLCPLAKTFGKHTISQFFNLPISSEQNPCLDFFLGEFVQSVSSCFILPSNDCHATF